jgi:[ribosomal protein S18]-alanine N-acetyltransferase
MIHLKELKQFDPRFRLRRMYLEDLDRVLEIESQSFGPFHWSRNNFSQELGNEMAIYLLIESLETKEKFLDQSDGRHHELDKNLIVAYGGAWLILDEMHITTLGTDPEFRRNKLAEAIINNLIEIAVYNKIRGITLEVRESNIAAQKLYEKYGFQKMGLRKNYYEDNQESALILWTEDIQTPKYLELLRKNQAKLLT